MSPSTPAAVCRCHCASSGRGPERERLERRAGGGGRVPRLADRRADPRALSFVPGDAAPRHRRLRHRSGRSPGVRNAGRRARCGWRPRNGHRRRDRRPRERHQSSRPLPTAWSARCGRPSIRAAVRRNAERFSRARFLASFTAAVEQAIADKAKGGNADAARWGATAPPVFPDLWPPAAEDEGHPDGLPVAAPRADTGNEDLDVAGRSPGSPRGSSTGSPEPPLVDSDAARMPAASPRDSSAHRKTPLVDFDAARMPQRQYRPIARTKNDAAIQPSARAVLRAQRCGPRHGRVRPGLLPALPRRRGAAHPSGEGRTAVPLVRLHAAVRRGARAGRVPRAGSLPAAPGPDAARRLLRGLRRQHPRGGARRRRHARTTGPTTSPSRSRTPASTRSRRSAGRCSSSSTSSSPTRRASSSARRSSGAGRPASASSAC